MHELPITESILSIVLKHATANKVRYVVSIKIFNMGDGEAFFHPRVITSEMCKSITCKRRSIHG